ncbi:hypothetical protein MPRM_18370 [Mycobacterium parmense]|uniref:Uncharacterized protein n=1 Tax=Mycobacterium parmense TaxID=185642 RepID=A0A7I7YRN6_9MYCO|nr:hypothetical protein MPRM_18370 [Mycobacterium parmense]
MESVVRLGKQVGRLDHLECLVCAKIRQPCRIANQDPHRASARQKAAQYVASDESRCAGEGNAHGSQVLIPDSAMDLRNQTEFVEGA